MTLSRLRVADTLDGVDPSNMDRGQVQVLGDPANVLQPVPRIVPPDELR
jgi:hypothetical protein